MPRKHFTQVSRLFNFAAPVLLAALGLLSACDKNNEQTERRYCDQSGCFACTGDSCYPVPGDPAKPVDPGPGPGGVTSCDSDAVCGTGKLCNLGRCEASCREDANCSSGSSCVAGRCRPTGAAQCGVSGALCTENAQCGSGRSCVANACATACPDSKCAAGQVCQAGACIEDPMPTAAQCTFDLDCGGAGAFRCINAYCLPTCTESKQCQGGAACVKGTCRGNRLAG